MPFWKVSCEILGLGSDIKELEKKKRSETTKSREKERNKQDTEKRGLVTAMDVILGTIDCLRSLSFCFTLFLQGRLGFCNLEPSGWIRGTKRKRKQKACRFRLPSRTPCRSINTYSVQYI